MLSKLASQNCSGINKEFLSAILQQEICLLKFI